MTAGKPTAGLVIHVTPPQGTRRLEEYRPSLNLTGELGQLTPCPQCRRLLNVSRVEQHRCEERSLGEPSEG